MVPFGYLFEAIPRLAEPEMPQADGMLLLSIFGIAVNGYAAYKLSEGNSLNERVLNWQGDRQFEVVDFGK